MTFGPPELAQLMQEAKATIAVAMLSSAGAGIVLGSIIACCNIIRAKRQRVRATGQQVAHALAAEVSNYHSSQADITDDSGAGGLAGFGRIAPGGAGRWWASSSSDLSGHPICGDYCPRRGGWSPLLASHIVRSARRSAFRSGRRCARHIKGVRIREGLQPTRHSTLALERGTSAAGSESTCSVES